MKQNIVMFPMFEVYTNDVFFNKEAIFWTEDRLIENLIKEFKICKDTNIINFNILLRDNLSDYFYIILFNLLDGSTNTFNKICKNDIIKYKNYDNVFLDKCKLIK